MNNIDTDLRRYILEKTSMSGVSPYGSEKWDSSAKKLEDDLHRRGFNFDKKLFYKYKLPNGMSTQQFMDTLLLEYYFVEYFSYMKIMRDKNLTMKQKIKILAYVLSMKKNGIYKNIKNYADEIKRLNPELSRIDTENLVLGGLAFVEGALFGFAPDEIKYFCKNHRNLEQEHRLVADLKKYGVYPSYILAPETAKYLIANLGKGK